MQPLDRLGWAEPFSSAFDRLDEPSLTPARVALEHRDAYVVLTADAELRAAVSGRLRHRTASRLDLPAVGDWVAVGARPHEGTATIHHLLPRRTSLVRKEVFGRTEPQVVAANVDTVFVVTSLNSDFSPRRLERYLALVWESGAVPVIVLAKSDLCDDVARRVLETRTVAFGVPVVATSGATGEGIDALAAHLAPGSTAALVGSSGVGKSTLVNRLVGDERMVVRTIRERDDQGQHTTTGRHLLPLPCGAVLVDTPGMRELALWDADEGLSAAFGDVEGRAASCRFTDCRHAGEPGCAVQGAIEDGTLDPERLDAYRRLQRELAHLERKQDQQARLEENRRIRALSRRYEEAKERRRRLRDGM